MIGVGGGIELSFISSDKVLLLNKATGAFIDIPIKDMVSLEYNVLSGALLKTCNAEYWLPNKLAEELHAGLSHSYRRKETNKMLDEGRLLRCRRCGKPIFLRKKAINGEGYVDPPKGWSTVRIHFYDYDENGDWTPSDDSYCPKCTEAIKDVLCILKVYTGEYHGADPVEEVYE